MRSFLLLLSLMTGCEARSEVKVCSEGWVEFTCKYPEPNKNYRSIDVVKPKGINIRSTQKDVWQVDGKFSVYHDSKNKKLRVVSKQLQLKDSGEYECRFETGRHAIPDTEKLHLVVEEVSCQNSYIQTAHRTAETTITCDYPGNNYNPEFLCKDNKLICEDILSTQSSPKSNGTFTLTETISGFNVSISNVSSQHAGVYWCGVKTNEGSYRAALRKIQLKVNDITTFTRSPTIGQDFTYWCRYPDGALIKKFICKGEDPSICQPLVSTAQLNNNTGKFSMRDDKKKRNITITVREVTTDDTGTYWCGASSHKTNSNTFFHRFQMTVVSSTASPASSTSPVSSTQSTSASAESRGDSQVVITTIVCVAVLLLLFVLILILINKRVSHSRNTRNEAAAQHIKEDYVYEEIQQYVTKPHSGNPMNTIYATANFPTNPSASLHYSTIHFQKSSDRAGGEALILKPSSAACEYSTVKHSQSPTYSTVNEPSRSSEDPLYSTVNKPQQQ